jgi:hypothetical protein
MPLIAVLLSHYWKPLALAALVAAAFGYRGILLHERNDARAATAQLTAETAALRVSNQALGATIGRQNAALAELKAEADAAVNAMDARADSAVRAGAAARDQAQEQGRALSVAPIDAGGGCEGAIQWGNARAAELARW